VADPVNAIQVENLVTHYGDRQILKSINLSVHEGEVMVIMGGSGSGKSTLLRYILGLEQPSSGHIYCMGDDITQMTPMEMYYMRQKMGVSFQGGALFGSMTIGENVRLPLREHTKLDENTMKIISRMKLELVNMADFEDLMPSELSGGMLKRAALARAIVMDPPLLFFDEPSAGLDPVTSAELDNLIIRLRDVMKMTIIIVTHELDSAFTVADRIVVLDQGEMLICGTVDEVKNCKIQRVQDLLNRRARNDEVDGDIYLDRLTT